MKSSQFQVGDLVIMQKSKYHAEFDGSIAEVIEPLRVRHSRHPDGHRQPAKPLYQVRIVGTHTIFSANHWQLRPLASPDEASGMTGHMESPASDAPRRDVVDSVEQGDHDR